MTKDKTMNPEANYVIDKLGGEMEVARICDVLDKNGEPIYNTVYYWRKRGLPRGVKLYLKEKYPNVFPKSKARS